MSSQFAPVPKILLYWVLAELFGLYKLHPFLEQELGCLDDRIHGYLEALISLPGQEHTGSCILAEVPRPVFSALFPRPQIVQEIRQELEPMNK